MIVVDNSALVAALVDPGPQSETVRVRMQDDDVVVPSLVDLELANVLRRMVGTEEITAGQAERALREWSRRDVERVHHDAFLGRVWELRDNLTPCDAVYVALAEALGAPLLTLDGRLARAPGIRCAVELIT